MKGHHLHSKGYLRVSAGPLRNKYIHRIVAAAMLGRELRVDEDVHHKDFDKTNFHWTNLVVMGHRDHTWVSSKQHWYMKTQDERLRIEYESFVVEKEREMWIEVGQIKEQALAAEAGA